MQEYKILTLRFVKDGVILEKMIEVNVSFNFGPPATSLVPVPTPGQTVSKFWQSIFGTKEIYYYDPQYLVDWSIA